METLAIFGATQRRIRLMIIPQEITDIKEKLRFLKEFYGYSLKQVSQGIGEKENRIKNYFDVNAKTEPPGIVVVKLAKFFNVPVEELEEKYKGLEHLVNINNTNIGNTGNRQKTNSTGNIQKTKINSGKKKGD